MSDYKDSDSTTSTTSYEDIIEHSRGQVKCTLCNVLVPDNDNCIEMHIDGGKHSDLYKERFMVRNSFKEYSNGTSCKLCDTVVSYDSSPTMDILTAHVNSTDHTEVMDELENLIKGQFLDLPENVTNKGNSVRCTICNCNIGFTIRCVKEHIVGDKHTRARAMAVQPENGIFTVEDNDEELWCKICNEYIDNCIEDILNHVDDNDEHNDLLSAIEDLIENEEICIEKFLTDVNEDKAYCEKCNVEIPCNKNNLTEHINGRNHSD